MFVTSCSRLCSTDILVINIHIFLHWFYPGIFISGVSKTSEESRGSLETPMPKSRKNRRALNKNRKNGKQKVCLTGVNCAGLTSKMESFKNLIIKARPCVFFLQETKFRNEGKLRHLKEYQIYELIRKKQAVWRASNRSY